MDQFAAIPTVLSLNIFEQKFLATYWSQCGDFGTMTQCNVLSKSPRYCTDWLAI